MDFQPPTGKSFEMAAAGCSIRNVLAGVLWFGFLDGGFDCCYQLNDHNFFDGLNDFLRIIQNLKYIHIFGR